MSKILERSPKYIRIPKIVKAIDPTEEEFKNMIATFPFGLVRTLKAIFEDGTPIAIAGKRNGVSASHVRYYLEKMHVLKHGVKYEAVKNG